MSIMFRKFLLSLVIMLLIFPYLTVDTVKAEVIQVDNEALKQLLNAGVPLIDVRTASEWQQTGIIEGSHLLTFFDEKGQYDVGRMAGKITADCDP